MKCFAEFFHNAYYHCLHYVVNKRLHWFERLFWSIWIILSMIGVIYIVSQFINSFYSTKASIRVSTNYLDFVTPFPAIFFCEKTHISGKVDKLLKYINFTVSDHLAANDIENYVKAATFIRPGTNPVLNSCDDVDKEYCRFTMMYKNNFPAFLRYIRATCEEIFASCTFNEEEFNCCEQFLPVDTFEGKCYAINSFNAIFENKIGNLDELAKISDHSKDSGTQRSRKMLLYKYLPYMMRYNPKENPARLSIELVHSDMYVWYLGNTNVPTKMYQKENQIDVRDKKFIAANLYLRVQEVVPDVSLFSLEMNRRNCRFWHENSTLKAFKIYSNSACEIECLKTAQMKYCGCVVHLLPNQNGLNETLCDEKGVLCTARKTEIINYLSFECKCISNCHFMDIFSIGLVKENMNDDDIISFRHEKSTRRINFIVTTPTVRYVRYANQQPLDFIVSIGGAISLLIGCSFLSIGQIFYYFLLKPVSERWLMDKTSPIKKRKTNILFTKHQNYTIKFK